MKRSQNPERILWSVLGVLARMALMVVFVLISSFGTIMSFDSGFSIKNLINAIAVNLLAEGVYLFLIWKWTPQWQRVWWISAYSMAVIIELTLLCCV